MNILSRRRAVELGAKTVALNFASAVNAGGGFLTGAVARDELLVRSPGLFACVNGNPMYEFHSENDDPIYTDYVLYSRGGGSTPRATRKAPTWCFSSRMSRNCSPIRRRSTMPFGRSSQSSIAAGGQRRVPQRRPGRSDAASPPSPRFPAPSSIAGGTP